MDLPELKGTEKQVKWANDIRANLVSKIDPSNIREDVKDSFIECWDIVLRTETSASFWINTRNLLCGTLGVKTILRHAGCYTIG